MTTLMDKPAPSLDHVPLKHARLPRWAPLLVLVIAFAASGLVALLLGWGVGGDRRGRAAALPGRAAHLVARGREPSLRGRPLRHRPGLGGPRPGLRAAGLAALDRDPRGRAGARRQVLHLVDAQHRRREGRHLPRDHRHPADHRLCRGDLGADRPDDRDLPRRVRRQVADGLLDPLPGRRDDRHPLDRRRPVRLRAVRGLLRPRRAHGARRWRRAVAADDPDRGALLGGDAQARPDATCARRRTPWACRSGRRSSRSCCPPRSPASSPASRWPSPV